MKRQSFVLLALTLVFGFGSAVSAADDNKVQSSLIVSTEWVAKHLNDDSLVLLQVGDKDEYLAAHIPGAQFITLADISTPRGQGLVLELPSVDQLKATFEKLGVTDKSRIVVYFGKDWVTPTARVFMTLDYLGLGDRTSILDGGLPAWRAEKRPVTAELREPKARDLHAETKPETGRRCRVGQRESEPCGRGDCGRAGGEVLHRRGSRTDAARRSHPQREEHSVLKRGRRSKQQVQECRSAARTL